MYAGSGVSFREASRPRTVGGSRSSKEVEHSSEVVTKLTEEISSTVSALRDAFGQSPLPPVPPLLTPPSIALARPRSSWGATRRGFESASPLKEYQNATALSQLRRQRIEIPSLRPPSRPSREAQPRALRPPLSAQLAAIVDDAGALADQMRLLRARQERNTERVFVSDALGGTSERAVLAVPAIGMSVGPLHAKRGDTVRIFDDRAEYLFVHPFLAVEVEMVMYRRDLIDVSLLSGGASRSRTVVSWRLARPLEAFRADLEGTNGGNRLTLEFVSPAVAARVSDLLVH